MEAISFRVVRATLAFGKLHERGAALDQAWANLVDLSESSGEAAVRQHASSLITSLAGLAVAVLDHYPNRAVRLPTPDMPASVAEAARSCPTDFRNLQDLVSEEDRRLLLEIQYRGVVRARSEYEDTRLELDIAREEFITVVRTELSGA
ncbi:hypothetical protein [Streptomyces avermitilis]|uniref:hypothetical protein n=1 Tax=Streptomyces avermitilis TaxID=33903 RepID=UPI003829C97C